METYKTRKNVIKITKGKEYRSKIDKAYQNDVFFADAYALARDRISEICSINRTTLADMQREYGSDLLSFSDNKLNSMLRGRVNNVLAFCADRGQGKTTAMRSFLRELEEYSHDKYESTRMSEERICFWSKADLPEMYFVGSIDPTAMSVKDSILTVLFSRMFNQFAQHPRSTQRHEKYHDITLEQQKNELMRLFLKCFREIEILRSEKKNEDMFDESDLDRLSELGDSSNLLASIYRLVDSYLQYVLPKKEAYLVIAIDDADMNISQTYQILEDVRKYLLLPNVIILMAANMTQLEITLEQYFMDGYSSCLRFTGSMGSVEHCHEIAELCLEKVIPSSRRIFLPKLEEHWQEIWIRYQDKAKEVSTESGSKDKEKYNLLAVPGQKEDGTAWTYQEQLLHFLHKKTGMVFLPPKNFLHNLLPKNFRELTHFLAYFGAMPDVENCYENVLDIFALSQDIRTLDKWKKNLNLFQQYVVNAWATANLRENSRQLFRALVDEPASGKHSFILKSLPGYYSHERRISGELRGVSVKSEVEYQNEFLQECKKRGVEILPSDEDSDEMIPSSASYADVMAALDVLKDLPDSKRQFQFIYAIRLYYSIYLHQLLLKRLDNREEVANKECNLSYFMRDAFYKNQLQSDYWRIPVKNSVLLQATQTVFGAQDKKNEKYIDHIAVNSFFRCAYQSGTVVYTDFASEEAGWEHKDRIGKSTGMVFFSPFYPLLRELDVYSYLKGDKANEGLRRQYSKETDQNKRQNMLASFVILLNWDVQYTYIHTVKRLVAPKANELAQYIYRYIFMLYTDGKVSDFYKNICMINADICIESDFSKISPFSILVRNQTLQNFFSIFQNREENFWGFIRTKVAVKDMIKQIESLDSDILQWNQIQSKPTNAKLGYIINKAKNDSNLFESLEGIKKHMQTQISDKIFPKGIWYFFSDESTQGKVEEYYNDTQDISKLSIRDLKKIIYQYRSELERLEHPETPIKNNMRVQLQSTEQSVNMAEASGAESEFTKVFQEFIKVVSNQIIQELRERSAGNTDESLTTNEES